MGIRLSTNENLLSTNLITSQLIHRQTLSTCYDAIFDLSLGEQSNFLLISDDNRLRLFEIDEHNQYQLVEKTSSLTKRLLHEQVYDIIWSNILQQFLVLTSKRMILYDKNMDLVDLELHLDKNSPPLWRMACWSIHLIVNLGLGTSLRYYQLQTCQSVEFIKSYSRTDLGYTNSDLLSTIILSPQSILGINVELANNRHIIDLYSLNDFVRLKRVDFNDPCPLDLLTSLRDYTWLCKSHWPSDDCLCLIESDGQVSKCPSIEIDGYILNLKISIHRSFIVLIRTANKLPKEIDINELNRIDEQEQEEPTIRGRKREVIGKLPGNLLLEIYQVKKQNQSTIEELKK